MTTPRAPASPASVVPHRRSMFGLASASSRRGATFGALGAVSGVAACVVVVGGLMWSAATGQAPASRHPTIFGGSLVLDDYRPLTVIDLATGAVTVQLEGVYAQVGASTYADVEAVPTSAGTMLVNRATGVFNMLGQDNYVLGPPTNGIRSARWRAKRPRPGMPTPPPPISSATPPPARSHWWTPRPWSAVLKLCPPAAAKPPSPWASFVWPTIPSTRPVERRWQTARSWILAGGHGRCAVVRVAPSAQGGQGLAATARSSFPAACSQGALESSSGAVALARPGVVRLFEGAGPPHLVAFPGTAHASQFLPVQGVTGGFWFLARLPSGWTVFGLSAAGRPSGPRPLDALGPVPCPPCPPIPPARSTPLTRTSPGNRRCGQYSRSRAR